MDENAEAERTAGDEIERGAVPGRHVAAGDQTSAGERHVRGDALIRCEIPLQNYRREISPVHAVAGLVDLPQRHVVAAEFKISAGPAREMLAGHDPADMESGDHILGVFRGEQAAAPAAE